MRSAIPILPALLASGIPAEIRSASGSSDFSEHQELEGLPQHLKLDRFHHVGTDAGGGISWDFALSFPHRVASLVITSSMGGVWDPSRSLFR